MMPELRLSDADRKALLLVIWKFLRAPHLRRIRSTQMTAEPRTQAAEG